MSTETDHSKIARLIFPHQLFEAQLSEPDIDLYILIEDDLFFRQYEFHKQKLILHRASMKEFQKHLQNKDYKVDYVETDVKVTSMDNLAAVLKAHDIESVSYYDVVDDWLQQQLDNLQKALNISYELLVTPAFLTNRGQIESFFADNPNRMKNFYTWQRQRLDILLENGKPIGGKWNFDEKNRKPLPKNLEIPEPYKYQPPQSVAAATEWVEKHFPGNPGSVNFRYPVTHAQAEDWLQQFLQDRFQNFGPFEDAMAKDEGQLFHSALSSSLNIGLLTPEHVVNEALAYAAEHGTPLAGVEGFARQIIGWREYIRATYVQFGRDMRTRNHMDHHAKLGKGWWDGTTGLDPADTVIRRVLDTAYAHHIERLMILGNAMLLLRTHPEEVYKWFMGLFIDAYDWVMVPNVYAMSQFADGTMITTKPYISGSNYIIKMSDYKKGGSDNDWSQAWDALYWRFIADHRQVFENNYRSKIMVSLYDRLPDNKKTDIKKRSDVWFK